MIFLKQILKLYLLWFWAVFFFTIGYGMANAQDAPPYHYGVLATCHEPDQKDSWLLEPNKDIPGEYLFTYMNNQSECSSTLKGVGVTADDGFRVVLYVTVGVNANRDELIYVIPPEGFMAFPPEIVAPDSSEPFFIRLIPGIS